LSKQFHQVVWDERLQADWQAILRLAVAEDLGQAGDCTSRALVPEDAVGRAAVVARQAGVMAGLPAVEMTLHAIEPRLRWTPLVQDAEAVPAGGCVGRIDGPARGLLAAERLVLNVLGRLSGIATLTRRYVEAVAGTRARIYDTRKTTPGWRRLEKYAVRCGGGWNHRSGLDEAVLIKDNHLALGAANADAAGRYTPAEAVRRARQFIREHVPPAAPNAMIVEIEVDHIEQLVEVLAAGPDLVLLDNMTPARMREAVARRNALNRAVELEASGGVSLETVRQIAETGVERISVGALTHSAACLDLALDWLGGDKTIEGR
jgi:nicotinate-nucleotide pyrophosphorylase (carboxylating)